ncbi:MAG: hypothetical protein NTW20_07925, partial [Rhodobacterales bacterium]|nr:hypothetical protein [Rhodobacterales bacterium]
APSGNRTGIGLGVIGLEPAGPEPGRESAAMSAVARGINLFRLRRKRRELSRAGKVLRAIP